MSTIDCGASRLALLSAVDVQLLAVIVMGCVASAAVPAVIYQPVLNDFRSSTERSGGTQATYRELSARR